MKLRKLDWWEVPKLRPKAEVRVLPVHTKETIRTEQVISNLPDLESLKKEVEKLKKRKPEYFPGGSGSVGSYHRVEVEEIYFQKTSFNPGINVIGVASGMPTTIWLPKDLEPNHLIAVKDELGVADQQPISIRVRSS